jgi:hypothetical protein
MTTETDLAAIKKALALLVKKEMYKEISAEVNCQQHNIFPSMESKAKAIRNARNQITKKYNKILVGLGEEE